MVDVTGNNVIGILRSRTIVRPSRSLLVSWFVNCKRGRTIGIDSSWDCNPPKVARILRTKSLVALLHGVAPVGHKGGQLLGLTLVPPTGLLVLSFCLLLGRLTAATFLLSFLMTSLFNLAGLLATTCLSLLLLTARTSR